MEAKTASIIDSGHHKHMNRLITYEWTMLHLGFRLNWLLLCYLAMVVGNNESEKTMKNAGGWQFRFSWRCSGRTRDTSPDGAHLGLHLKPLLDAAIGQVPAMYCPGSCHGRRIPIKHTNTNNTQLLASNYGTFWSLVVYVNSGTRNGPFTQLINTTSCVKMWNSTIGAEELMDISSYQTLSADKK